VDHVDTTDEVELIIEEGIISEFFSVIIRHDISIFKDIFRRSNTNMTKLDTVDDKAPENTPF